MLKLITGGGKTVADKGTVEAPAAQKQGKVAPEATSEQLAEPMRTPGEKKTFTVTVRPLDGTGEETLVGEYDTLYDAMENCKENDLSNEYVVTLNKDYAIPSDEGVWDRRYINLLLKSAEGKKYTLKRLGTRLVFYVSDDCKMRTENIILDGNKDGELTFLSENGELTLGNGTVVQNFIDVPSYDGPAIFLLSGTLNILEGVTIENCVSNTKGGVIEARKGTTVNISGGTFRNNKSNTSDGGFLAAYGKLNITGGTFGYNEAKKTGGAIIIGKNETAEVENAIFKGNKASTGGAIYALSKANISDTTFDGNEAKWGGAIFATKGLILEKSKFINNSASSAGGTMYLTGGADIKDSEFKGNNSASSAGGAIYSTNGKLTIDKSNFTENKAEDAGAIYLKSSEEESNVTACNFKNNEAAAQGGAIWSNDVPITVTSSTFDLNKSGKYGGALCFNGDKAFKIEDSTISNGSSNTGGGIFVHQGNLTIKNSALESNVANTAGGGISSPEGNSINLINSKIKNNQALSGAGVLAGAGKVAITGTEFSGNDTGEGEEQDKRLGGGLYIGKDATVNISESSQFIGNKSGMGGAIFDESLDYKNPADTTKYQNLKTDETTLFKGNIARTGLFIPPTNFDEFTKLAFSSDSDVPHIKGMAKSLLNNYDVNYKGDLFVGYDANGGKFEDGTETKFESHKEKEEITLMAAPTRDGYKFMGWKGSKFSSGDKIGEELTCQPGEKLTLDGSYTFVAQWKEDKPEPKPEDKPAPKHHRGGGGDSVLNKEDHYQYLIGYEDDSFKPENNMTREEVAVMFSRLLKNPPVKGQVYPYNFPDVDQSRWSVTAISYMNKLGIVKGYPDGDFKPEASITRAEFAAMAAGFANLQEGDKTFSDLDSSHWAYDVVRKAASAGWISGYPDGTFKADNPITRAEVVSITNKMLNRKADQDFVDRNLDKLLSFIDLNKDHWAYYPIMEATSGHDYIRNVNKVDEKWQDVTNKSFVYDK